MVQVQQLDKLWVTMFERLCWVPEVWPLTPNEDLCQNYTFWKNQSYNIGRHCTVNFPSQYILKPAKKPCVLLWLTRDLANPDFVLFCHHRFHSFIFIKISKLNAYCNYLNSIESRETICIDQFHYHTESSLNLQLIVQW